MSTNTCFPFNKLPVATIQYKHMKGAGQVTDLQLRLNTRSDDELVAYTHYS